MGENEDVLAFPPSNNLKLALISHSTEVVLETLHGVTSVEGEQGYHVMEVRSPKWI